MAGLLKLLVVIPTDGDMEVITGVTEAYETTRFLVFKKANGRRFTLELDPIRSWIFIEGVGNGQDQTP